MSERVSSPCIKICKYDDDNICVGCHRTMDEITGWLFMSEDRKRKSLEDARKRRESPKPGKFDYDHYV